MKRLVAFPLEEGGNIVIEIDEPETGGTVRAGREDTIEKAKETFEEALGKVLPVTKTVVEKLRGLASRPASTTGAGRSRWPGRPGRPGNRMRRRGPIAGTSARRCRQQPDREQDQDDQQRRAHPSIHDRHRRLCSGGRASAARGMTVALSEGQAESA